VAVAPAEPRRRRTSAIPASCERLDLGLVERTLTKHYGDITAAAREIGVPGPHLRRLTWARPELLESANDRMGEAVARAWSRWLGMLNSRDPRKRERAADRILASYKARNSPYASALAPAPRSRAPNPAAAAERARLALERQACAERALEREQEGAAELEREREFERLREDSVVELVAVREVAPHTSAASLWPSGIRRPTRGRRW
jgi:hypothetical protein